MAGSLDTVTSSIGYSLDFAMKNFKELAVRIAKVYILNFAIFMAAMALLAVLFFASGGKSLLSWSSPLLLPFIAIAIVVLVAAGVVNGSIAMVRFMAVEDVSRKAPTSIIAGAAPLIVPFIVYTVSYLVLIGVFVGVPVGLGAVLAFSSGGSGIGTVALVLAMAAAAVFAILLSLVFQFAGIDIAINKSGGIDALKRSYALVRKNLAAVIIYDIILFIISFAIGMVFGIVNEILSFGLTLGALNIALLVAVAAVYILAAVSESILINTVLTPVEYFFWKALGGKR